MKHQMLSRLSRLFSSSSSNTATPKSSSSSTTTTTVVIASCEPSHYNHSTVRQKHTDSNGTQKKSRWSTLGIGRKTKRQGIPVGEWLPPPLPIEKTTKPAEKDTNRDSVISSTPSNVGCYYEEKVEIIVPSASINSFLSTTSNNSGHQHASIYFSSPCMSPQLEVDEHLHTPRTSIDDQESQKPEKPYAQVHGLGIMVNHILKDAFTVADHDIFDKDDFYD